MMGIYQLAAVGGAAAVMIAWCVYRCMRVEARVPGVPEVREKQGDDGIEANAHVAERTALIGRNISQKQFNEIARLVRGMAVEEILETRLEEGLYANSATDSFGFERWFDENEGARKKPVLLVLPALGQQGSSREIQAFLSAFRQLELIGGAVIVHPRGVLSSFKPGRNHLVEVLDPLQVVKQFRERGVVLLSFGGATLQALTLLTHIGSDGIIAAVCADALITPQEMIMHSAEREMKPEFVLDFFGRNGGLFSQAKLSQFVGLLGEAGGMGAWNSGAKDDEECVDKDGSGEDKNATKSKKAKRTNKSAIKVKVTQQAMDLLRAPEDYLSAEQFYKEFYHDINHHDIDHPVLLVNQFANKIRSSHRFYQLKPGSLCTEQTAEIAARWVEAVSEQLQRFAKKTD